MKLSTKGRYAVLAMADVAAQSHRAEGKSLPVSLSDIAVRQGISISYLEQLFHKLRRAGLVVSQRGATGGYRLSRSADEITVDQIIAAVNEDIRAHGCDPNAKLACTGLTTKCLTHSLWGALENHIDTFLTNVSLTDVLTQSFLQPSHSDVQTVA